mmetsp:Transcript_15497/g.38238  ORF Transcript_15497/g.38238 Transcript_15497/m.38238 type:complete len:254 (-) Transcript_15497:1587-2348(-)
MMIIAIIIALALLEGLVPLQEHGVLRKPRVKRREELAPVENDWPPATLRGGGGTEEARGGAIGSGGGGTVVGMVMGGRGGGSGALVGGGLRRPSSALASKHSGPQLPELVEGPGRQQKPPVAPQARREGREPLAFREEDGDRAGLRGGVEEELHPGRQDQMGAGAEEGWACDGRCSSKRTLFIGPLVFFTIITRRRIIFRRHRVELEARVARGDGNDAAVAREQLRPCPAVEVVQRPMTEHIDSPLPTIPQDD